MENMTTKLFRDISKAEAQHLEAFAAAYLKMTDIPPDEAVLVREMDGFKCTWRFERKKDIE